MRSRTFLAVLAGFLIAGIIGYGVEFINSRFWLPEGVNWFSMEEMKEVIPTLPLIAGVPNLIGAIVGMYLGTRTAGRIARSGTPKPGYVVTALVFLQGVIPQFIVEEGPFPIVVGSVLMLATGYFGSRAGAKV
jgi:hypothetical protein